MVYEAVASSLLKARCRRVALFGTTLSLTMKVLTTKNARFSAVVDACGEPRSYTLWQEPKKDRHLQSQIRLNRIMTIKRTASGGELGLVGFVEGLGGLYLEFPKSLKRFVDQRIVGIKWELVKS